MIRIGVVNIDVSHPLAFSEILLKEDRARYTAVYNDGFRGDDEVEAFIGKRGLLPRCKSVEELARAVDLGFIQGCNWSRHLDYAECFLRLNKPVFIDKPLVGSMADIRRLKSMMGAGLEVMGSSSMRYARELTDFMERPEAERGRVLNVMGTCGVDEFNYGIHVVEGIGALLTKPLSCRFASAGVVGGLKTESYAVSFRGGETASYITVSGVWLPCDFLVTTTGGVYPLCVDASQIYKQLLDRICDRMEKKGDRLAPVEDILDSIKIMLAGRLSRERGGELVRLDDIPEDDPGFDGCAFEREYAANAKKIYLGI